MRGSALCRNLENFSYGGRADEQDSSFFVEGYEEIEALTVVDICRRAGVEVQMVSVSGEKIVSGSHGIGVRMDMCFDEVDFDSLDMIVLPGGPGTEIWRPMRD